MAISRCAYQGFWCHLLGSVVYEVGMQLLQVTGHNAATSNGALGAAGSQKAANSGVVHWTGSGTPLHTGVVVVELLVVELIEAVLVVELIVAPGTVEVVPLTFVLEAVVDVVVKLEVVNVALVMLEVVVGPVRVVSELNVDVLGGEVVHVPHSAGQLSLYS